MRQYRFGGLMRGGISLSLVLGGLLAVGAVAGLVFLLSQVQAVNWREHYEVRDAIRELQELDMQLNVRLLMARQDLPQEEHAVARVQALMRETEERIFADIMASGTSPVDSARLGYGDESALVLEYYDAKSKKQELIEHFLSLNDALKDRVDQAVFELNRLAGHSAKMEVQVNGLRPLLLLFLHDGSEDSAQKLQAYLDGLLQDPATRADSDTNKLAKALSANILFILQQLPNRDATLLGIVNAPTATLNDILNAYTQRFSEIFQRAEIYRLVLIAYASMLLLVLLVLALRLRHSYATLEHQVGERTQQLAKAYDELKQSQLQMMQAEKMASLGQMVAGVAHEINTPLGFSRSNVEIVRERLGEMGQVFDRLVDQAADSLTGSDPETARHARQLQEDHCREEMDELLGATGEGLDQISELVKSLRDFSRLDRSKNDRVDLNKGIDDVLRIVNNTLRKCNAQVHRDYAELPLVECAPSQINQVLLNLIVNAAQALPELGGNIAVSTKVTGRFVEINVEDDGHGIPAELLPRVFDPFVTTKELGKGTGLGLSIAYQIVQDHGGALTVESTPGTGTCFTLSLPVT
nr:ATP-binding protein [uncultured Pseudomonas sp.]